MTEPNNTSDNKTGKAERRGERHLRLQARPDTPPVIAPDDQVGALGSEIRQLRKVRGLTLSEVAKRSGKSIGFLSKVERNLTKPSVMALQDIGEALGVHIGWFFPEAGSTDDAERGHVVRAGNRRRLSYSGLTSTDYLGLQDFLLSANLDGNMVLGLSQYAAGASTGDDKYTHSGEEAGMVISGNLELTIGTKTHTLRAGDSFSFGSDTPHRYHNPGPGEAVVVWANSPINLRP